MAKDQLEGENVRQVMISFFNLIKYLAGMQVYVEEILSRAYCIPHSARLQEELKRKLSERNKLLTEYEVRPFIIYTVMDFVFTRR